MEVQVKLRTQAAIPRSLLEPVLSPAPEAGAGPCGPTMFRAQFRSGAHQGHLLLQLLHVLQHSVLGLGVLQQHAYVEHIVQVRLDLHLQLVALREPKPLSPRGKGG